MQVIKTNPMQCQQVDKFDFIIADIIEELTHLEIHEHQLRSQLNTVQRERRIFQDTGVPIARPVQAQVARPVKANDAQDPPAWRQE